MRFFEKVTFKSRPQENEGLGHWRAFWAVKTSGKCKDSLAGGWGCDALCALGYHGGRCGCGGEVRNKEKRREWVGEGMGPGAVWGLGQMVSPGLIAAPTPI